MQRTGADRWTGRPVLARALRWAVWFIPFATATVTAFMLSMTLPSGAGWGWGLLRLLTVAATATLVMRGIDRLVRRTLPLASLLELTLVFPDDAPSRVAMAMRAASSTELSSLLERYQRSGAEGPAKAAEHLLDLVAALSRHDHITRGHSERVRAYSQLIGAQLGLTGDELDRLRWAGLIHDIGKLRIDADILNKPGRLTDEEFDIIKTHPDLGAELAAPLAGWLGESVLAVSQHHEKWDGSGYPRGLAGTDISLHARIVAVADVFDVITSARSYKPACSAQEARAELARCAGTHFDPEVVRAFLHISLGRLRRVIGPVSWVAALLGLSKPATASSGTDAISSAGGATTTSTTTSTAASTATSTATSTAASTATSAATTVGSAVTAAASTGAASAVAAGGASAFLSTAASGAASLVAAASGTSAAMGVTVLAGIAATGLGVVAAPTPVVEPASAAPAVSTTTEVLPAPGEPVVVQVASLGADTGSPDPVSTDAPNSESGALRPAPQPSSSAQQSDDETAAATPSSTPVPSSTPSTLPTAPPTTTTAPPATTVRPATTAPAVTLAPAPAPAAAIAPIAPTPPPDASGHGIYLLGADHDGDGKSTNDWVLARREPRNKTVPNFDVDRDDLPGLTVRSARDGGKDRGKDGGKDAGKDAGKDGHRDGGHVARFALHVDRATTVKGDMTAALHLRVISDERHSEALEAKVQVEVLLCGADSDNCKPLASARFQALTAEVGSWPELDEQSFQPYKIPLGSTAVELQPGERLELRVTVVSDGGRDVVIAFDAASTPSGLYLS